MKGVVFLGVLAIFCLVVEQVINAFNSFTLFSTITKYISGNADARLLKRNLHVFCQVKSKAFGKDGPGKPGGGGEFHCFQYCDK